MSTKRSRIFVLLATMLLVATLIVGCAQTTPAPTQAPAVDPTAVPTEAPTAVPATEDPPAPTKDPVTLNVWIMDRVGTAAMEEVKTIIDQWAAETGNTVIVTEGNQFEMMNKIPVAIPAGEGPDLFMTVNNYIGGHYAAQLIVPVEDALSAEEKAKYTEGAIDSFTLDGHLLGIPIAADVNALVYNKKLVTTPPATMDELVTMSKALTSGDQYGLLYQIDSFWYSYPFFSAYGGYVFKWTGDSLDANDIGFDNEGAIEGLKYVRSLVETEKLMPGDVTWEVMNSYFTEGKSAMIITNPAMVPTFKDAGIELGVAPIPTAPNGVDPRPFATYTGFSVSAYSKSQAEAAALAAYLGVNLPLPIYKANSGNIPVLADVLSDPSLKDDAELAGWMAQLEKSDPLPSINEMNFVWAPATTAFQSVIQGKESADTALKAAQELIIQTIAENK